MGRPELLDRSEFATMADRSANMELLDAEVESWTRAHNKKELFDIAQANGVICAPVQDVKDLVNDPHLAERGSLQTVNVPTLGDVKMPKTALRFKGVEPPKLLSSPALGQDNVAIYGELLGLDAQTVAQLQKDEAI
jgi:crotonobetainyl-CoA:carnitine CoA-transferase CaiB-like acyl-CoA transferase